ncbi:MAG: prephenate dehydratase [Desulfosudaceae bacterium]
MEIPEKNNSRPDDAARLEELRREIDETDQDILARLNRRAELCREVGRIKSGSAQAVFKPFREKEVLERLTRDNPGVLPEDHLRAIYREILSSSRKLQQPQKAVYLGPEGTFSYFAGVQMLGGSTVFEPCRSLDEVFRAVADKEASLGIVPLENSGQGSVGRNLDLFLQYPVYMQAEIYCRIGHHLMGAGTSLAEVNQVYSHPRALEQCTGWLERLLPEAAVIPARSTAAAARAVVDQPERAVIGHRKLADMFALNLLAADIEDIPDNWTRFVVIGPDLPEGGSRDKTSLLFTLPDRSGALVEILTVLARSHINMTKLESRPMKAERWRYLFFADVECDLSDDEYAGMKQDLAANCHTLRVLGSYPAGKYLDDD